MLVAAPLFSKRSLKTFLVWAVMCSGLTWGLLALRLITLGSVPGELPALFPEVMSWGMTGYPGAPRSCHSPGLLLALKSVLAHCLPTLRPALTVAVSPKGLLASGQSLGCCHCHPNPAGCWKLNSSVSRLGSHSLCLMAEGPATVLAIPLGTHLCTLMSFIKAGHPLHCRLCHSPQSQVFSGSCPAGRAATREPW